MNADTSNVCRRCKHWSNEDSGDAPEDGKEWRECARTRHGTARMFEDEDPTSLALARSQRDVYWAVLITQPTFGCLQFEEAIP